MTERCHLFKLKQVLYSGKQTTSRDRFANQLPNQYVQKTTAFPLHISEWTTLTVSMCSYVNCTRNHGNCMQKLDANCTVNLVFKRGSNLATLYTEESSSNYNVFFKPLRANPVFPCSCAKIFSSCQCSCTLIRWIFIFFTSPGEMDEFQLLDRMLVWYFLTKGISSSLYCQSKEYRSVAKLSPDP